MKPLHVDENRAKNLNVLASIDISALVKIADELETVEGVSRHSDLRKLISLRVEADTADSLLNNIAALSMLRDDGPNTSAEVVDALIEGCKSNGYASLSGELETRRKILERLVSLKQVYHAIKSAKLFAADSLHLHDFKIYCDSRPLFGPDRREIESVLLFSTLHLIASDKDEIEESVRVALRRKDLQRIIDECNRAIEKLAIMEVTYQKLDGIEVFNYGIR